MAAGNKPKNVDNPYTGRTSPTRKEWMGDCAGKDMQKSQDPIDQQGKKYGGDVTTSGHWFHNSDASATDSPNFDHDKTRKGNAKPVSTGGGDTSKSPFSLAGRSIK